MFLTQLIALVLDLRDLIHRYGFAKMGPVKSSVLTSPSSSASFNSVLTAQRQQRGNCGRNYLFFRSRVVTFAPQQHYRGVPLLIVSAVWSPITPPDAMVSFISMPQQARGHPIPACAH
jgi:hypothetical protein